MTILDLLHRLDDVRSRGPGRWVAQCPSHNDRTPSLSIREGQDGRLLVHDFGGCSSNEIVAALGLGLKDLFTDSLRTCGSRPMPKPAHMDLLALAFRYEMAALDRRLRADRIAKASKDLALSKLNDAELDWALTFAAQAHTDIERAELYEHVADVLRVRDFTERINRERQVRVA